MKINCEYCGFLFDDSQERCPHCGAPNEGVVRQKKNRSRPTTIEELQDLYIQWNLPPYETTRFFIGQNYKGKRAFGIYRDESTGNVVVYKNKDNGQRAIRYEGTDEAFAVNEIYQRLKQEIVNQRSQNAAKKSPNSRGSSSGQYSQSSYNSISASKRAKDLSEHYAQQQRREMYLREQREREAERRANQSLLSKIWNWDPNFFLFAWIWKLIKFSIISTGVITALLVVAIVWLWFLDEPMPGYYRYEGQPYYYYINENHATDCGWFGYDNRRECWIEEAIPKESVPHDLKQDRRASEYFESKEWTESLGVADFSETFYYQDRLRNFEVDPGYYQRENITYYHIGTDPDLDWYYFNDDDTDWQEVDYEDIPEDFKHGSAAEDFYYTPEWDASTQFTDFYDSDAYTYYMSEVTVSSGSSSYSGSSGNSDSGWKWDDDDDDDFFTWGDDDDWDWGGTDWDSDW